MSSKRPAASVAGTNRQQRVASSSSSSSSAAPSPPESSSKLVFGLNARARTRTKYDEYAEQRLRSTSTSNKANSETTMTKTTVGADASGPKVSSSTSSSPAAAPAATQVKDKKTSTSVRARSRSPDSQSSRMGRRKSFDEDLSTIKLEPKSRVVAVPAEATTLDDNDNDNPGAQSQPTTEPTTKAKRNKFNITPPKQMSIAGTSGKGSVVGFAKARIYDKPAKKILPATSPPQPNPLDPTWSSPWSSLLDDRQNAIPKSIRSGSKPPKQVNVSKAREKWEGGEPFTKCKSRQRLAAQANKKLFPGTWSMTSVVATQQLHLQQALAQASAKTFKRSNFQETDPSVKVLTRGSVLERVQQFERVPTSGVGSLNGSPASSSMSSLTSSHDEEQELELALELGRSLSLRSSCLGLEPETTSTTEPLGKKAHYKDRVSSIQLQQQQQQPTLSTPTKALDPMVRSSSSGATNSTTTSTPTTTQQRRLTFSRRRSSTTATTTLNNSTTTTTTSDLLIPRFYHPNGQKPNTYELELQKRNIVACFDTLPDRSAQLDGGPASRRHFHQIAIACSMSEYFKVPLCLYVRHKLETCPHLFTSAVGAAGASKARKTSTVSLVPQSNGVATVAAGQPLKKLARSNSVASNQPTKTLIKASSIDSTPAHQLLTNGAASESCKQLRVTCDQFLTCWRELISQAYDNVARFVQLLTLGQRPYLLPEDFVPLIQSIIDDHPGLKFLRAAPDFHMRYIQTVIARIYFNINRSWTGKITLQELRRSNLLAVLQVLSQEEDINQITDYFSYEHFYVIYCKFWNLDQDHDLLISKADLARHNDAAISSRIIERIFSNVVSKQIHKTGKMNYSDFVWFLIAEEDKKHPRSIEYWFRLIDLDGDGYISMYEMEYFYYEQMKRLELMNIEPLPFLDSACQILDLVNPREKNKISLADLKHTKMATIFFDTFINLEKYLEHESREFVSTRDVVQDGVVVSDWDRYASEEYESLVTEETTV